VIRINMNRRSKFPCLYSWCPWILTSKN
jgi:hypothetical protein